MIGIATGIVTVNDSAISLAPPSSPSDGDISVLAPYYWGRADSATLNGNNASALPNVSAGAGAAYIQTAAVNQPAVELSSALGATCVRLNSGKWMANAANSDFDSGYTVLLLGECLGAIGSLDMWWAQDSGKRRMELATIDHVNINENGTVFSYAHTVPTGSPIICMISHDTDGYRVTGSWNPAGPVVVAGAVTPFGSIASGLGSLGAAGTYNANMRVAHALSWTRGIAFSELSSVVRWARAKYNLGVSNTGVTLLAEGDSITAGYGNEPTNSWAYQAATINGWTPVIKSTDSSRISTGGLQVASRLPVDNKSATPFAKHNIFACMVGINDLFAQDLTIDQICSNWSDLMTNIINSGWELVACTILPADNGGSVPSELVRGQVNNYIRRFCSGKCRLLDWDRICPTMATAGAQYNSNYYLNQGYYVHPTAGGQTLLAQAAAPLLASWYQ